MGPGSGEEAPLARVGVAAEEGLQKTLESLLGTRFRLVTDGGRVDLRLIGPDEFREGHLRLLRRHRLRQPGVPVIVIAPDDCPADTLRDCFREGATDVLIAHEVESGLVRTLEEALQRRDSGRSLEDTAQRMAAELGKRARELEQALSTVRESYDQTLAALVGALDFRERETACHSQRVALYAVMVGIRLDFDEADLEDLYRGSLLHDIGKIGTPDAVLLKPDRLTEDEWEIMREHANLGADLCERIRFLRGAACVPMAHHEAWDGTGYPRGLQGQDIPLHARIFAVVDTYDAIRSKRPYKPALPHEEAVRRLRDAAGSRLDPSIVERFVDEPQETWEFLAARVDLEASFDSTLQICQEAIDS